VIQYTETIDESSYNAVRELVQKQIPGRQNLSAEEYNKALEGSTYVVLAYDGETPVGVARVISDGLEWTLLTDLAVESAYQKRGVGSELVKHVQEHFRGHEIFTYTYSDTLDFYESLGFERSKNAFTYGGFEGEYLTDLPEAEFYLPLGYRYETEFYPFAGDFPVGRKSGLDLSKAEVRYTTDASNLDYEAINALLSKAFGGDKDLNVTKAAFENSRYYAFAYVGDALAGCARAVSDGVSQALILNVAVDPDYQGLHIGQQVVDLLAEQMKGQNLYLNTHPGGVGFYNRRPYYRNKTALLYPAHPDMPEEIAKGFVLPKGYRFEDELGR